jgi:hypothetical protein
VRFGQGPARIFAGPVQRQAARARAKLRVLRALRTLLPLPCKRWGLSSPPSPLRCLAGAAAARPCPLFWALSCVLSRVSRRRGGLPEDYRRHHEARDGQVPFFALRLVNSACARASVAVTEASERVSLPSVSRGRSADVLALHTHTHTHTHSALTCAETRNPKL